MSNIILRIQLLLSEKRSGNTENTNELRDLLDYLLANKHITYLEYLHLNK